MLATLLFFLSACGLGKVFLAAIGWSPQGRLEKTVWRTSAGLGLWGIILFFLGCMGWYRPVVFLALAAVFSLALPASLLRRRDMARMPGAGQPLDTWDWALILPAAIILGITLVCCFSPVTGDLANDELSYHLSVPREWMDAGGIIPLKNFLSYTAGYAELWFLWTGPFLPGSGPRLTVWLSFALIAAAIFCLGREKAGRRTALCAVLIAVINPLVFRSAWVAFVDLPAALFWVLSVWLLIKDDRGDRDKRWILSAFFLGICCGIKPTGYFYSLVNAGLIAAILLTEKQSLRFMARRAGAYVMICGVVAAPWIVRTFLVSGSPVFPPPPFLYSLHHGRPFYFSGFRFSLTDAQSLYAYFHSRGAGAGSGLPHFLLLPWNLTMHPEALQAGDTVGTILLSFLPVFLLFFRWPSWVRRLLLCGTGGMAVVYFLIFPEARYLIPALLLLSVVLAWTLTGDMQGIVRQSAWAGRGMRLILVLNVVFSLGILGRICADPVHTVFSRRFREEYRRQNIPYYDAFSFLKTVPREKIVVGFQNQIFYYLRSGYRVDPDAASNAGRYSGFYFLDIDYTHVVPHSSADLKTDYFLRSVPPAMELVFAGRDAKVYRFR
jgi:4-amino-4-deoxy-L-arabinose transferase-like glycosyltransferase